MDLPISKEYPKIIILTLYLVDHLKDILYEAENNSVITKDQVSIIFIYPSLNDSLGEESVGFQTKREEHKGCSQVPSERDPKKR